MKKLFLITAFIFFFVLSAQAQKVEVEQSFVDDATRAFNEVVALRAQVKTLQEANAAKDAAVTGLTTELRVKTQEIIDLKSHMVEQRAIIQFLLQNGRKKIKIGIINF